MSSFEKIGVIFVTGLVAVILAMSFFGTGHEALPANGPSGIWTRTASKAAYKSTS